MRLLQPSTTGPIALLTSWATRLWLGSVEYRFILREGAIMPRRHGSCAIYVLWHENLVVGAFPHARMNVVALISASKDGEWIARTMQFLGLESVRGSSSRKGSAGLRGLMRLARQSNLAITPDGPRGPRRVVQSGAIYLASRTGTPIVPLGLAACRYGRIGSWDRMLFPAPGTTVYCVYGPPVTVPPRIDSAEQERYRQIVQSALDETQEFADSIAEGRIRTPSSMSWNQLNRSTDGPIIPYEQSQKIRKQAL